MTTRIHAAGPSPNVAVSPTAARTTAPPARPFQQVMRAGADAIVSGAETAAARLPGGSILVAAMRGAPQAGGSATSPVGPSASAEIGGGAAGALPGTSTGALPGSSTGGTPSIERVLDQNADQNLYFLGLQERISQENRAFTTVSNVLKARHETVKNAIGNIR
jgi:hypothetical protein